MVVQRRDLLEQISREAGACLRSFHVSGFEVRKKSELDLITVADETSEKIVVQALRQAFPEDAILAEEGSSCAGSSGYQWIIDPLDGTTNFTHGFPQFCVSIALAYQGQVISGAVFDPIKDEMFLAHRGEGASLNGKAIRIGAHTQLSECLVVTGFSYDRRQRLDELLDRVRRILTHCQGMRRLGSAALDLAYVACGRFDVYLEDGLHAWDIAAGQLIVCEAGGRVSMLDGSPYDLNGKEVMAANPSLLPLAREALVG